MRYFSHPNKLLKDHIRNIISFDENDKLFVLSAKFHDLGKVTNSFQEYIQKKAKKSSPHSLISGTVFLLQFANRLDLKSNLFIFNAIISHHGKLNSLDKLFDKMLENVDLDEIKNRKDVVEYFDLREFDLKIIEDFEFENNDPTNPITFTLEDYVIQKELFSKLIFADKYEAIFSKPPLIDTKDYPLKNLYDFKERLPKNSIRDIAKNMVLSNFDKNKDTNIYLLTAPTGIGKTLLSLELALKIKKDRNLKRIIYAIPFTSIIDQTVEIFETIYKNSITKHHHKVEYDIDEESFNNYDRVKFLTESWSEPFIVSTFYQLFFALFSNKNVDNIKFQSLKDSVIVLDEVQAIPHQLWSVMQNIFEVLAKKLNIVFVLMSATMPILTKNGYELCDKKSLFNLQNRYKLDYLKLNGSYEEKLDILKDKIIKEYQNQKSVLCVVNTIKNSKILFQKLKDEVENIYCLNSYMLQEDRQRVLNSLKEPNSNMVKSKILISTQVIEAGVDLDFDVGFRELSPLSSIIQTCGRVNREGKKSQSTIYVFDTLGFQIYDLTLMNETKKHLLSTLKQEKIEEKNILLYIENYFKSVKDCLGDSKEILKSIREFDFAKIDKAINEIFSLEKDFTTSVAIGIDLSKYENEYFEMAKRLSKWELKSYKERLFKKISKNILNIKNSDLETLGFSMPKSNVFGLFYIKDIEDIYSPKTGFLIQDEKFSFMS